MRKPPPLIWIVLWIMLPSTVVCAADPLPLEPPRLSAQERRAERYLVTGRTLTGIGIAHGLLALGIGLGFGLGGPKTLGDHNYRDFIAIPLGATLGASAVALLGAGIPLWVAGARARRGALATVSLAPSALSLTF